jgi:hypothetical protein
MAYTNQTKINDFFGASNVNAWCNLSGTETAGDITTRVTYHVTFWDAYIDAVLRRSPLSNLVTFTSVPTLVELIATVFAGVSLYEAAGVRDADGRADGKHALAYIKEAAMRMLEDIAAQRLDLNV